MIEASAQCAALFEYLGERGVIPAEVIEVIRTDGTAELVPGPWTDIRSSLEVLLVGIDAGFIAKDDAKRYLDNIARIYGITVEKDEQTYIGFDWSPPFGRLEGQAISPYDTALFLKVAVELEHEEAIEYAQSIIANNNWYYFVINSLLCTTGKYGIETYL